jgi:hypothetical protein
MLHQTVKAVTAVLQTAKIFLEARFALTGGIHKRLPTETVVTVTPKAWDSHTTVSQDATAIFNPKPSSIPELSPVA